jgi:hypothetical protein
VIRIVEDINMVDGPFEDWSKVRSHGRATRRRRRGFPQRIRVYYTPKKEAFAIDGGQTFIIHPAMTQALLNRVGSHARNPLMLYGPPLGG